MTSASNYSYVQSSSRLIENQDENSIGSNQEVPGSPDPVEFYQDDTLTTERQLQDNQDLHKKRFRALSISKDERQKHQDTIGDLDFFNAHTKRRHNSVNEVKSPPNEINARLASNNGIDMVDIKSSFRKILNAGKQFQHSISVQSVKSTKNKLAVQSHNNSVPFNHQYDRSQSYNHHQNTPEYEGNDNDIFTDQELNAQGGQYDAYLNANDSKLNFLSKSFDDKSNNIHSHLKNVLNTPPSVAEESLSATSSTSQSSTPSSVISKNRNDHDDQIDFLIDNTARTKLFTDENNNSVTGLHNSELVHMSDLKLVRNKKNDSIRMRHHSSKQSLYTPLNKADLKMPAEFKPLGNSNSVLVSSNGLESPTSSDDGQVAFVKGRNRRHINQFKDYFVIILLFVVNLLNYIDRYTLAGVIRETQDYFHINDGESGLLQTVFIVSYMLLAPLFGYLGDRYPRKWLVIFGISFWSAMTFLGSFVPGDKFWLFMLIRCFVGIGEASYSCVAPTIIGDLFTGEVRTRMLAIFYLAVPVGSGMGYIVGSNIAMAFGDWRWSLRFTPALGFICVILLIFFVTEPKRGGAEGSKTDSSNSSMLEDAIYLCKNKTFVWVTIGFTFASFVLGGLSWWVPIYVETAILSKGETPIQIPLIFGIITCFSGLFGVAVSSVMAPKLRNITNKADALICAVGSLIAVPTLYILILITRSSNQILFWFIVCIAISAMCLSWTIVADILLYVVHPNKRSIASALNILIIHLFGDAFSPYVIGAISDSLKKGKVDSYYLQYTSLQSALYAGPFFALMSFGAYLLATFYIEDDKKKVELMIKKSQKSLSEPSINDKTSETNINQIVDHINENDEKSRHNKGDLIRDSNEDLKSSLTNQEIN